MTLNATLTASIQGSYRRPRNLGESKYEFNILKRQDLVTGTGVDQADLYYESAVGGGSIPDSPGFVDLDLNAILLDAIGDALPLVTVKGFYLYAYPDNASNLIIGAAAANPWPAWFGATSHTEKVRPGELVLRWCNLSGHPVTLATGDILRIAKAAAGNGKYDLVIIGTSA